MGVGCQIARALDKDVDYIDLRSHSSEFAAWRNIKHNFGYNMVIIDEADFILPRQYDILYTDAVWEHLPPDKQLTYATKLASYVNIGGMLYFFG